MSHPNGVIGFEWDDRGLLTAVSGGAGSAGFSYDGAGRMVSRVDSTGTLTATWTARGELDTVSDPVSGVVFDYEWTGSSLVDSVSVGSGLVRDYSYDPAGRVVSDVLSGGSGLVSSVGYGYDRGSNLVSEVVLIPGNDGSGAHSYTYDFAGRLGSWTHGGETVGYVYDGSGNRIQAGADTYSFDARNRLTTGPEGSYSYTPRGTLTSVVGAETHTYDFDSLDRLVAFDGVNYTYDGLGRVASRGADTFTYTGFSLDPSSDGEYVYGRSPGGSLLSVSDGSETVLVGRDRHGDVTHLFDASGSVEFSSLYDPFGDVTTTAGTRVGSVGFQGDWTDPDSEHVWMGARWYDGGWATFLSRDTVFGELSTSVSLNRYTYAGNSPLVYWDLSFPRFPGLVVCVDHATSVRVAWLVSYWMGVW